MTISQMNGQFWKYVKLLSHRQKREGICYFWRNTQDLK